MAAEEDKLAQLFGLPENRLVDHHHIVVLHKDQEDIGVLAVQHVGGRAVQRGAGQFELLRPE